MTICFCPPFSAPFGSKFHPSISKVKLVIRKCVIRVWLKLSLSRGVVVPLLPLQSYDFFVLKRRKDEKTNSVLHTTYPQKLPEQTSHRKKIERINSEKFGGRSYVTQNSSFRQFVFLHQRNLKNGIVTLQGQEGDTPPRERELEPNMNYTFSDYQLDFRNRRVKF